MRTAKPRPVEDLVALVESRKLTHVKVGVADIDGVLRGKYCPRQVRLRLEGRSGFCDVILGWDSNDQLYDNVSFTGWHTGLSRRRGAPAAGRCRDLPFEEAAHAARSSASSPAPAEAICPRGAAAAGARARAGHGLRRLGRARVRVLPVRGDAAIGARQGLSRPAADHAGHLRLLDAALSVHSDFYHELLVDSARRWTSDLEGLHTETGPGVIEAAIPSTTRSTPPTRRPCSRPSSRSSPSGAAGWRPSWRNGRAAGRASAATSTCR